MESKSNVTIMVVLHYVVSYRSVRKYAQSCGYYRYIIVIVEIGQ